MSVPINDGTLIPHFKYVSMHTPQDKSIYLLYLIKKSIKNIKNHKLVDHQEIVDDEAKIDKLLKVAWETRGQYPGFRNVLEVILKNDFEHDHLQDVVDELILLINEKFGGIKKFINSSINIDNSQLPINLDKAIRVIERRKDLVKFLALFDFSIPQIVNVIKIINKKGFETISKNPYQILENYYYDECDNITDNSSDYGIDLFIIDIALIPDPKYADWATLYDANSPERLRAVVSKVLDDTAKQDGNSCLTKTEILKRIEGYALYYIIEKLGLDIDLFSEIEKQSLFKERFIITNSLQGEPIYQLKKIRDIENIIEQFVNDTLKKKYVLEKRDFQIIDRIVTEEKNKFKDKIDINERKQLYENSIKNGLFVLSGKAGSGKTNSVVNLIKKFRDDNTLPIYVFTPTGKANLVIRNRLKEQNLSNEKLITVSTIHRFLYRQLFEYFDALNPQRKGEVIRLSELVEEILDGNLEALNEFVGLSKSYRFSPQVVIIDESSMIDELLLAALFSMINPDRLKHLILVGDEKQLPPIGLGRPFVDIIYNLKKKDMVTNMIHLNSNLRFDTSAKLGLISEFFSGDKAPLPPEVDGILEEDKTLSVQFFNNGNQLKEKIKTILLEISNAKPDNNLSNMFAQALEDKGELNLEKIQIITPRRVGSFGSWIINMNLIRDGNLEFTPKSKLICEQNIYVSPDSNWNGKKILALANGSSGYVKADNSLKFDDIDDLFQEYQLKGKWIDYNSVWRQIYSKTMGEYNVLKSEKKIDFGYALTVHKVQGSDFNFVILVIPEISPFIVRELIYTAVTRAKQKLFVLINENLKEELAKVLIQTFENSSIEQRQTLLFDYKLTPYRPYPLKLKNGEIIEVKSKIEFMIAKKLDQLDVQFEYEPQEFLQDFHIKPDFKISIGGKFYYLEHLGRMDNFSYRNRWHLKFKIYGKLGFSDILITTSENDSRSNIEENVSVVINDIKLKSIKKTEGSYSKHHYYL